MEPFREITKAPPPKVAATLASLASDGATAEVVRGLDVENIPALLLKGPAIASWLYGPGELRNYSDVDLLVPSDAFEEAGEVLCSLGFERRETIPRRRIERERTHACLWVREQDHTSVDLHFTFHGISPTLAVWDVLSEGAEPMLVAGSRVLVPSQSRRALIVVLHALHHPGHPQCMEDLRRCIDRCPEAEWQAAQQAAERLGVGPSFRRMLHLVTPGAQLLERLSTVDGPIADERFDWLLAPVALSLPPGRLETAQSLAALHERVGFRAKTRLLLDFALPSADKMRRAFPLARRGWFGLVLAHLWRYVRLLGRLPRLWWATRVLRRRQAHLGTRGFQIELAVWAMICRLLLGLVGIRKTVRLLDAVGPHRNVPRLRSGGELHQPRVPRDVDVRGAGSCLPRALARSQYLRRQHTSHELVIGMDTSIAKFIGHAWLEPYDPAPDDFEVIWRIPR